MDLRVAVVGLPALLDGIVRALIEQDPGARIVPFAEPADVVVCGAGAEVGAKVFAPLLVAPHPARVVIVSADGRSAYFCTPAGELSPAGLRDAIRGAGTRPRRFRR